MSFKLENLHSKGSLVPTISYRDYKGELRAIRKGKEKEGHERDAGYLLSILGSVGPTLVIGAILIGTCVYRGNKQQEEFRAMATAGVERQSQLSSVRIATRTPRPPEMMPGQPKVTPMPTPTNTEMPTSERIEELAFREWQDKIIYQGDARYSYYWPPLGGINCEEPCDIMASGQPWRDFVGIAVACPGEFPIGSYVELPFGTFQCLDRGSAIIFQDGIPWIDHLSDRPVVNWSTIIPITVYDTGNSVPGRP